MDAKTKLKPLYKKEAKAKLKPLYKKEAKTKPKKLPAYFPSPAAFQDNWKNNPQPNTGIFGQK